MTSRSSIAPPTAGGYFTAPARRWARALSVNVLLIAAAIVLPPPNPASAAGPGAQPSALCRPDTPGIVELAPVGTCRPGSEAPAPGPQREGEPAPSDAPQPAAAADENGSRWEIVASPNVVEGTTTQYLLDTACATPSDCWAVGYVWDGRSHQTLVQHWDGNGWTIAPTPNFGTGNNRLYSVTCASTTDCWTVGWYFDAGHIKTLTLRWDGRSWERVDSPNATITTTTTLLGVDCVAADDCWAVGSYSTTHNHRATTMHWDGSRWTMVDAPHPAAAVDSGFAGVTCVSSTDCWAVGVHATNDVHQPLAQHWDGTSWSVVDAPTSGATVHQTLLKVTCVSSSDCWSAGYEVVPGGSKPRAMHWDGTSWTIADAPSVSGSGHTFFSSITCVSSDDCLAVGEHGTRSVYRTMIQRWDGRSWSIQRSANSSTSQNNTLTGVTCTAANQCWAAGAFESGDAWQTLVQRWDGTSWNVVASPNTLVEQPSVLSSATCVSHDDCWAVGYVLADPAQQTLIQHWDGTSWAIVRSPNTSKDHHNHLSSVTCTSSHDCWAVGSYTTGIYWQTLIQHWDGTRWEIVPSSNTDATRDNQLRGVTCASPNSCWAVGRYQLDPKPAATAANNVYQTLVHHWNGYTWERATSPNAPSSKHSGFVDVECLSVTDCWAIGETSSRTPPVFVPGVGDVEGAATETLLARWDGTTWQLAEAPSTSATLENHEVLRDLECTGSQCWAVGHVQEVDGAYDVDGPGDNARTGLVLHWDGTGWAIAPRAAAPEDETFAGVACSSASECWAVGTTSRAGVQQTLIERWDGNAWTVTQSPNAVTDEDNYLAGVACTAVAECWAVGSYGLDDRTLTLRYGPASEATALAFRSESALGGQHTDVVSIAAVLTDTLGRPIPDAPLEFELVGPSSSRSFSATTDGDGVASVAPALVERPGTYEIRVRYLGDGRYAPAAAAVPFVTTKEQAAVALGVDRTGQATALTARLTDADAAASGIAGREIVFYSDGRLIGSATTGEDGVATLAVPPGERGASRSYRAEFSGDDFFEAASGEAAKKPAT